MGSTRGGEPIDHHIPNALLDFAGLLVGVVNRMPISDEEQARMLVLELYPILQGRRGSGPDAMHQWDACRIGRDRETLFVL
jgi:hypothetical protein